MSAFGGKADSDQSLLTNLDFSSGSDDQLAVAVGSSTTVTTSSPRIPAGVIEYMVISRSSPRSARRPRGLFTSRKSAINGARQSPEKSEPQIQSLGRKELAEALWELRRKAKGKVELARGNVSMSGNQKTE
jgi:hypothetical protein